MFDRPVRRRSDSGRRAKPTAADAVAPPARGKRVNVLERTAKAGEMTLPVQYRLASDVFRVAKDDLMARPGVSGVDIAIKTSSGSPTGRVAVRVWVAEKVPATDLYSEDLLPSVIDGMPIDVVEGVFRVASGITAMGDGICPQAHPRATGALTGICQELNSSGRILLLTCAHVALGPDDPSSLAASINMTDRSGAFIGRTLAPAPGTPGAILDADLDCVLISPDPNRTVSTRFRSGSPFEVDFVKEVSSTDIGLGVMRPEGNSAVFGTLTGIQNNEYRVVFGDRDEDDLSNSMSVRNQLVISPGFAQRGNSGELVFTSGNTAVGMIRAVNRTGHVLAAPLYTTCQRLRISILSPRN